ncbi:serine hydrolase domain-containing protein [Streptomyces gardneri]|uniref:Esterase n=1 Tax=Streptomyces gardneri TaxID=66892 RepID=A0A4Y3RYE1_9ACTN|nr:serine hydrolase domain-containing protein [Streptomyces gardneri]GEB61807.1 esterase [Streptomyces gardneri]GHG93574.1 esterase [Streptomyces gardneri]
MSPYEPAARIRALLEKWAARRVVLGAQVFHRHGGEVNEIAVGEAAPGVTATPDVVGRVYCANKSVLAVAAGVASREGLIGLDDPVARFFGDCAPSMSAVTVADLLGHTSGLPTALHKSTGSLEERARRIVASGSRQSGPARYNAQSAAAVLGSVLERAYGLPLADVVDEKVARPLALRDLALVPRPHQQYVPLHRRDGGMRFVPVVDEDLGLHPANPGQAGVSTASDLGRLHADVVDSLRGEGKLLDRPAAERLCAMNATVQLHDLGARSWGLGVQRDLHQGILGEGWSPRTFGHIGTSPRRIVVLHAADPESGRVMVLRLFSVAETNDRCVRELTALR